MLSRVRRREPIRGDPMMRTRVPALTSIALLGFCIQANAQAPRPELTQLRSEAQEALKQSMTVPASERCYMYIRLSVAWGAVALLYVHSFVGGMGRRSAICK